MSELAVLLISRQWIETSVLVLSSIRVTAQGHAARHQVVP
jgi:hypothetical protein